MVIFVVGSARSGTTLMARILGRHSNVFRLRELHFFEEQWVPTREGRGLSRRQARELVARLMKTEAHGLHVDAPVEPFYPRASAFLDAHAGLEDPVQIYRAFLEHETARAGKAIPLTHTPRNLFYLAEILDRIEGARIIWMVRDPRAVLCSQKLRWRRPLWRQESPSRAEAFRAWVNYHPITYSLLWRAGYRVGSEFARSPAVRRVVFEALIKDPMAEIFPLLAWLGLKYEDDLFEVGHVQSSHHRDQPSQKGIDPEVLTRWRHSCLTPTEIRICQWLTRAEMEASGYPLEPARLNPLHLLLYLLTWLPRSGIAFLLNVKRTGDVMLTLRRRLALGSNRHP